MKMKTVYEANPALGDPMSIQVQVLSWTKELITTVFMDKRQERNKRFQAHPEIVYNKMVRSLRGRIKGVEGWEGGEWGI